jgi:hypothetical protein
MLVVEKSLFKTFSLFSTLLLDAAGLNFLTVMPYAVVGN